MDIIKQKENISLSNFDIIKIVGKVKIIKYPEIMNYNSIFEIFGSDNKFVIFFETESDNVGHWECCFMNKKKKTIEFFDSYGLAPDKAESFLSKNLEIHLKENKPLLTPLFIDAEKSGFICTYNAFRYQEMKGDISTCGRWCSIRLKYMNLTDQQFYSKINNLKLKWHYPTFDDIITKLTEKY